MYESQSKADQKKKKKRKERKKKTAQVRESSNAVS